MKLRGLYAVSPEVPDALARIEQALIGGVALLQYRSKRRDAAQAREALRLARRHAVPMIVNDDVELALEIGADGAHLGRDDGDLPSARRRLGARILGASCYNDAALAQAAVAAGADYVAFGAVFPSPTKPNAVRASPALFHTELGVPLCAIGGLTLQNAPALIAAGADLLAVITDLFEAPDITERARQYARLFT
ncbi:MAG: thiamine phosphate synthase [Betaproteobacteria bacterium]